MSSDAPQPPTEEAPPIFIYGNPSMIFDEGKTYAVGGYVYRYIGLRQDEYGQELPFLELVSPERVAPITTQSQARPYAPRFVEIGPVPESSDQAQGGLPPTEGPAPYTYGNPSFEYKKGLNYIFGDYMYRYIGYLPDENGQELPYLELVSPARVIPVSTRLHARPYSPTFGQSTPPEAPQPFEEQSSEPPESEGPALYIYGNPSFKFQEGLSYNFRGYMYQFIGYRHDEFGQELPFLELISSERVAPEHHESQAQPYAPKFIITGRPDLDESYQRGEILPAIESSIQPLGPPSEVPSFSGAKLNPEAASFVPSFKPKVIEPKVEPEFEDPDTETRGDITIKYNRQWKIREAVIKNVIQIIVKEPPSANDMTTEYLANLIDKCGLRERLIELHRKQPMVLIFEVKGPSELNGKHFAAVYDRSERGFRFTSRHITHEHELDRTVLCVDENGYASPEVSFDFSGDNLGINVRVLIVSPNGWLIYFAPDFTYILTGPRYLVFTSSKSRVLYRRVHDLKKTDGSETFLKQTMLNQEPPYDGLAVTTGIVQRDTANDGTFVVIGTGISILPMRQIQIMMKTGYKEKLYHYRRVYQSRGGRGPHSKVRGRGWSQTVPGSRKLFPGPGIPYNLDSVDSDPESDAGSSLDSRRRSRATSISSSQSSQAPSYSSRQSSQAPGPSTGAIPKRR